MEIGKITFFDILLMLIPMISIPLIGNNFYDNLSSSV